MTVLAAGEPEAERFVFFGPAPAVIEVVVRVDGGTVAENRRAAADTLMKRLDTDGSGDLTRKEADALEPLPGQSGQTLDSLFPKSDGDGDERLTAEELSRLLNSALGPAVVIDHIEGRTLRDLSLERFLDADADGRITSEEYADGFESLRRVDFDDDAALSAAELATFAKAVRAEEGPTRLLAPASEAADQLAGPVPAVVDRWKQRRWAEIDADGDGEVSSSEAAVWSADAEADLTADVTLAAVRGNRITLMAGDAQLRVVRTKRQRRRTRSSATMGEADLDFRVSNANFVASDGRDFLILKHRVADDDGDGRLSEAEFATMDPQPGPFVAIDGDRDGAVTRDELTEFLDGVQQLAQLQIRLDVEDVTANLFDTVDTDVDRRLSPREVRRHAEGSRVASAGRSVRITALTDVINFLGESTTEMSAARSLPVVRERTDGPEWFRRMDRNRDGDLQWREFLGPREAFDALDADGDELIDVDEAAAA